jgi:hypothetical protein
MQPEQEEHQELGLKTQGNVRVSTTSLSRVQASGHHYGHHSQKTGKEKGRQSSIGALTLLVHKEGSWKRWKRQGGRFRGKRK